MSEIKFPPYFTGKCATSNLKIYAIVVYGYVHILSCFIAILRNQNKNKDFLIILA